MPKDFWGNEIAVGDTIAVFRPFGKFNAIQRKTVTSINEDGALVAEGVPGTVDAGKLSNVKSPHRAFVDTNRLWSPKRKRKKA